MTQSVFAHSIPNTQQWAQDISNNVWVTMNTNILLRVRWFGKDFHEWWSHKWKSFSNPLKSDKKSVFTATQHHFISYMPFMSVNIQNTKQSSITHFIIVAKDSLSDLALWCHHSWFVKSREWELLVWWLYMGQVMKLWLSCYLVLLSIDSKTW